MLVWSYFVLTGLSKLSPLLAFRHAVETVLTSDLRAPGPTLSQRPRLRSHARSLPMIVYCVSVVWKCANTRQ